MQGNAHIEINLKDSKPTNSIANVYRQIDRFVGIYHLT